MALDQPLAVAASRMNVLAGPGSITRSLNFRFTFTQRQPQKALRIWNEPLFLAACSFFESARLLSLDFELQLYPNISVRFMSGFRPDWPQGRLAVDEEIYRQIFGGAQYGTVVERWSLPDNHPFGREMIAPTLGNPRAVCNLGVYGLGVGDDNTFVADLNIVATVALSGVGIPPVLTIATESWDGVEGVRAPVGGVPLPPRILPTPDPVAVAAAVAAAQQARRGEGSRTASFSASTRLGFASPPPSRGVDSESARPAGSSSS
jgi:hypothetical protein